MAQTSSILSKPCCASASSCSMARWGRWSSNYKLTEADYRGNGFQDWKGKDLKGSIELLLLTKPDVIEEIHTRLSRSRRGHHRNQHLQRHHDRPARFPFPGEPKAGRKDPEFFQRVVDDADLRALVHEINLAAAQHRAKRRGSQSRTKPDSGALSPDRWAAAGHRVALAGCERSEFSRGHVRSNPASLLRTRRRRCSKAASIS